jgi:peptide/nickel transport system permease protein
MSRLHYVGRRLLHLVPILFGVSVVVFLLVHLIPGDPARTLLGPQARPAQVAALRKNLGLDRPMVVQYFSYLWGLLRGNLGTSIDFQVPVRQLIGPAIAPTVWLLTYAAVLVVVFTIPLGIIAARWKGRWPDALVRTLPVVGMGMPTFWIGLMLILLVGIKAHIFPVGGWGQGFTGHLDALFLPAFTTALSMLPATIRSIRSSLLEVLDSSYVVTARAKGLSEQRVWWSYALRNALLPAITVLGVNLGWLIGNTVVTEQVFNIPGLGQLMIQGISNRDFPVVQSLTLVFAVMVVLVSLATDLLRTGLDPRVRLAV